MKQIVLFFLLLICVACNKKTELEDQAVIDRLLYVYNQKSLVDEKIWSGFSDNKFDVPIIYYDKLNCYIANPTEKFLNQFKPELIFTSNTLNIYKSSLLDSIPFHMQVSVSFDEDKKESYNYKSPYMRCSSPEITQNTVPDVPSTEVWSTMVMHEYFHGFQFRHKQYLEHFERNIILMTQDTLQSIYSQNNWYKESVDKENDMLLSAIASVDTAEIKEYIKSFFILREKRRKSTKEKLNVDISVIEEIFETMEGTARYVEFNLYNIFSAKQPDIEMISSDTLYQSYKYFKGFNFEQNEWLYKTGSTYYYAIGFNILRLLDKLDIKYKSDLFKDDISAEKILMNYSTE